MDVNCEGCLFWQYTGMERHGGYEGECRRYPPEGSGEDRSWPPTNANDWCGEWFTKEDLSDELLEDD